MENNYTATADNFADLIKDHYQTQPISDAYLTLSYGDKVSVFKLTVDKQKQPVLYHYDGTQGHALPELLRTQIPYAVIDVSREERLKAYTHTQFETVPTPEFESSKERARVKAIEHIERYVKALAQVAKPSLSGLFSKSKPAIQPQPDINSLLSKKNKAQ